MPLTPAHLKLRAQIAANDPRFEREIAAYFERPGEYRIKERPGIRYVVATPTADPDVLAVIPNVGPREVVVELPEA